MPIMTWILYADHQVDPLGRSLTPLQPGRPVDEWLSEEEQEKLVA
jgi:hypothetical protein